MLPCINRLDCWWWFNRVALSSLYSNVLHNLQISISQSKLAPLGCGCYDLCSHHFPFSTDVRSRTQDDQQTCLVGQIQKMLQISVSCEVLNSLYRFMEVPGHISVYTDMVNVQCL